MARLTSVALILFNFAGNIFVVRELVEKLHIGKRFGDFSFPWETREGDEPDESVLKRLVREEIDRTGTLQMSNPIYLGEYPIHNARATAYVTQYVSGPVRLYGNAVETGEIAVAHDGFLIDWGWVEPHILLRHMSIRDGVREIVNAYLTR